ncbi:PHA/PHB synthase family protein [Benzoatithermus flavus]|uniref:Class I poly(R)-hydroxyalkanoic acid synthase n=1 Tax=Benzoatithermus flavus TaxID=3108223 RepID=A0ABU8XX21_9PROT
MPETFEPDPAELGRALADLLERSRRVARTFLKRRVEEDGFRIPDPKIVGNAFAALSQALLAEPEKLEQAQQQLWQRMGELWQYGLRRAAGERIAPPIAPDPADKRFKDEAWSEDVVFDWIKQCYLLAARWLQDTVGAVEGLEPKVKEKVAFYTRQLADALSPTNFALTNPAVLRRAAETKGESLLKGLEHLLADLEKGKGELAISTTREDAFIVGGNLATSPGKVILENELMQLVQYAPSTEQVHKRPLLVVPPWINKFYILDLQPRNSFIKYAVDQGFTVFVISWVNPGRELAHKTFENYLEEGPLAALDAIERALGEHETTVIGYCLGGTLTACLLAWLAAKGEDRVKAATFLTTMTDFADPGELGVFIDDEQLDLIERHMQKKGYLEARHMQKVFSLMRANDLIWSFVVNNYLMGREPPAFDLLYWNADGTRMPCMMHSFYLRSMYQKNLLAQPGGIVLKGVPIDLGRIEVPCYFLSTREDHIAPWASTYRGSLRFGGPVRFVLGGSGHIAGVINPPSSTKYGYWVNPRQPADPAVWLARAEHKEGSWWPDWRAWLARRSGRKVPARDPARGSLPPIEDAPGRYVKVRASD